MAEVIFNPCFLWLSIQSFRKKNILIELCENIEAIDYIILDWEVGRLLINGAGVGIWVKEGIQFSNFQIQQLTILYI